MARNNPNITIQFEAKGHKPLIDALKELNRQQKKLGNAVKQTGSAVNGFNLRVQKATKTAKDKGRIIDKLNATIAVYRNRILLAAFATGLFAKTIGKLLSLYGEQELAERKLENAMGRRSQALLDFASAQQKATSFGDELTISAMSQIAAFTKNEDAIKQASIVATDFSAKTGKTMEESMRMITSTIFGTRNAFKTLGIEITNASNPTARFNSLMEALSQHSGGEAANQMGTYASQVRAFNGAVGDAGETLGKDFLELLTGVIRAMTFLAETFNSATNQSFNVAGALTAVSLGAFIGIKRFKALNAIMVLYKGAVAGAAISTKRMTTALKALGKSTALMIGIGLAAEGISKFFGQTEKSVRQTSASTKILVLDMADLRHELKKMQKDSLETGLNKAFNDFVTLQDKIFINSEKSASVSEKIVDRIINSFSALDAMQFGSNFYETFVTDSEKALKNLKTLSIAELEAILQAGQAAAEGNQQEITDFDKAFLKAIQTVIEYRKQIQEVKFAQSDWLDEQPKKLDLANEKLQAKIDNLGNEADLAMALLDIEAKKKEIFDSDAYEEERAGLEARINLNKQLNAQLKQINATRSTQLAQTSQLAGAISSMVFSVDAASLTWSKFGQTVIGVLNQIISKFVAEMVIFKLFSTVFGGPMTMTAPTLFGFNPFESATTSAPFAPGYATGGIIPMSTYHSGGGVDNVPIMAQEGEFVMRRSAVESIGVENLNRMNRTGQASGGVNVTFSGNVMSDDFVEDVAIPKIKDAIRRGADIGVS